jgi:Ca-activated chloride channel homolog
MWFAGWPLSTLLAVGGSVAALTIALYFLKLRRRPITVPFLPMWERLLRDQEASRLFAQLRRWLSLLLHLVMVALLVFALGDPRLSDRWLSGRHIVVLVDASASMQARAGDSTRLEAARSELRKLVEGLAGADRMLVAQLGETALPLSTLTDNRAELNEAVKQVTSADTAANLESGLGFALDALAGRNDPEVVVISDGAFRDDLNALGQRLPLDSVSLRYVPIGASAPNVAVTAFAVRRYPLDKSRYEVLLSLANQSDEARAVQVTLLGDGQAIDVSEFHLQPREELPRFYENLGGGNETLEAVVTTPDNSDVLGVDNHAFAFLPERRRSKVLVITPGNTYLEAALLLDEYLDVTTITPRDPIPSSGFDVTIQDGIAVATPPSAGALIYLNPPAGGGPLPHNKPLQDFGFDTWDKKSSLLGFIAPENIQVLEGVSFKPQPGDKVVGASAQGPFLVTGKRDARTFVALGFDPRQSDMVLRIAWPLFILNSIQFVTDRDGDDYSAYRTGKVWQLPLPSTLTNLTLTGPDNLRRPLVARNGFASFFGQRVGFYELRSTDDEVVSKFAANFVDPAESSLEVRSELTLGDVKAPPPAGYSPGIKRELWGSLLFVVLLMTLVEWFTFHRRVTV